MMLANGAKETTTTTGTGTVTLSAVTGFPRFSQVLSVGTFVDYAIQDGNNWEWGVGKVAASNTLERTLITAKFDGGTYSKNPATGLSLSGSATVFCTPSADTFGTSRGGNENATRTKGYVWSEHLVFTGSTTTVTGHAVDANTLTWVPWLWPTGAERFATGLSLQVTTAAGTKARVGIVELGDAAADHRLILQTSDIDTSTTGIKTHTFASRVYLPLDRYAMVLITDGAPALAGGQGLAPGGSFPNPAALAPRGRWINGSANSGWTEITSAMVQTTGTVSNDSLRLFGIVLRQD